VPVLRPIRLRIRRSFAAEDTSIFPLDAILAPFEIAPIA
jgi:hypothetical protein